jgi:hypothetical protein
MMTIWRKAVDWIYNRLGLYAPDRCVFCGQQTGLALPDGGWPCCADCEGAK